MNHFLHNLITRTLKRYYRRHPEQMGKGFRLIKKVREVEVELVNEVYGFTFLLVGVLSASFGISGFLIPSGFIDGGVMGISLLLHEITRLDVPVLVVLLNLPFVILGYRAIGRKFALKSIGAIALLALALYAIPFPSVTTDPLLVAVFGGFFLGLGIGTAIRGGAIIDGTEVLAIFISRKSSLTVGNVILIFNLFIFSAAAYILSIEIALYAILTYFAASRTVDFIIDGIEEFMEVTIVSDHSEEIRHSITNKLGRGCTILQGKKGFAKPGEPLAMTDVVYTVITRLEMAELRTEVDKIDPKAFMVMSSVKDARGGMVKKKPIKMIH